MACNKCPRVIPGVEHSMHKDGLFFDITKGKAEFWGIPWTGLSNFGKRKFENALALAHAPQRCVFKYL